MIIFINFFAEMFCSQSHHTEKTSLKVVGADHKNDSQFADLRFKQLFELYTS